MKKTLRIIIALVTIVLIVVGAVFLFQSGNFDVLNPQGEVARKEYYLILLTVGLSLLVIIPVFTLLAVISWKFREGNAQKVKYTPDWDSNHWLEVVWWGIPCLIILVLGVVTWISTHDLDPYKPLVSNVKPVEVQVVSLQWKWLFIYPEQGIASVNLVQFPEKTPINFTITSDAPMNSFWIPSLGGQIYAMSAMSTKLHLMADTTGDYKGSSANISGEGFSDMRFVARSSSAADFETWVQQIKSSARGLDQASYEALAKPASLREPVFYRLDEPGLYDMIVMKYMMPEDKKAHDEMPMSHSGMGGQPMSAMKGME